MDGIYPVSLNWSDVETMARISNIKLTRSMIDKLNIAEQKTIEESTKR